MKVAMKSPTNLIIIADGNESCAQGSKAAIILIAAFEPIYVRLLPPALIWAALFAISPIRLLKRGRVSADHMYAFPTGATQVHTPHVSQM